MSEKYTATIENDYFTRQKNYWKVTIETNDLNNLNNIASAINLIKSKERGE